MRARCRHRTCAAARCRRKGGVVFSFARMNRILELDVRNRRARVQPGLINLRTFAASRGAPASFTRRIRRRKGPRRSAETSARTPAARIVSRTARPSTTCLRWRSSTNAAKCCDTWVEESGYDLDRRARRQRRHARHHLLRVGASDARARSRTRLACRVSRRRIARPPRCRRSSARASCRPRWRCWTASHSSGRSGVSCGYPTDAGAVLLVESAGFEDDLRMYEAQIARLVRESGRARPGAPRDRKQSATPFGPDAKARSARRAGSRRIITFKTSSFRERNFRRRSRRSNDACTSRGHQGRERVSCRRRKFASAAHVRSQQRRTSRCAVIDAGNEILQAAVDLGGTISGEHGIGYEKARYAHAHILDGRPRRDGARARGIRSETHAQSREDFSGGSRLRRGSMTVDESCGGPSRQCDRDGRDR